MADTLEVYVTTFNCGRKLIDVDYFAANLFHGCQSVLPPDLLVLSLQEIAPIAYSFLGGSLLTPYFTRLATSVHDATTSKFGKGSDYSLVSARNVGMTAIMLFARRDMHERILRTQTAAVGVGLWAMGNKGAVGVRLVLEDKRRRGEEVVATFVAAHLAPMEEKWERRNRDWKSICEGLVFEEEGGTPSTPAPPPEDAGTGESEPLLSGAHDESSAAAEQNLFAPPSYIFFAGDLNYRTSDTPPTPDAPSTWPQPSATSSSDPLHYTHLLTSDQLTREKHLGKTLHHLTEAPISFPPTYKYSTAAQKTALHAVESKTRQLADGRTQHYTSYKPASDEDAWLWARHRTPSWCDRILYLAPTSKTKVHSYTALPVQPTSDHRPVALSLSIPLTSTEIASVEPPFVVRNDWRQQRAMARRLEIVVGLAAYLSLTWEGEALLAGTIVGILGGYVALRALLAAI